MFWVLCTCCSIGFHTLSDILLPDTEPGRIGPPKSERSTLEIAVAVTCSPFHTTEPIKISPTLPSESTIPDWSKTPSSSPGLSEVIVSWNINNVDSPVSAISTLTIFIITGP